VNKGECLAERLKQPDPPEGGGLPDARLAERGGRRRAGVLATTQPLRHWLPPSGSRSCCTTYSRAFDEIAPIVGRSPTAARLLANRARRRVQPAATVPDADLIRQREVVDAFLAASRGSDFDAFSRCSTQTSCSEPTLVPCLSGASREVRGALVVAEQALIFLRLARFAQPALVNGAAGVVVARMDGHFR
jgi:hypothetical protein